MRSKDVSFSPAASTNHGAQTSKAAAAERYRRMSRSVGTSRGREAQVMTLPDSMDRVDFTVTRVTGLVQLLEWTNGIARSAGL